jgi:hypothetical protein
MSALDDFFGLPRLRLCPIGISFATGGGFTYFNRIAKPTKCIHVYFFRKYGIVHFPCFQFSWFGNVTIQIAEALFLNCSNVFQIIPLTCLISSSLALISFLDGQ